MHIINQIAKNVSRYNRLRKWTLFLKEFPAVASARVLDVGYEDVEDLDLSNHLEKAYPYPSQIVALGITRPTLFRQRYKEVRTVIYDGTAFPFADHSFDLCWSNAVLEHVGNSARQRFFLTEIQRVARRGWVTTPNRWFPLELHSRSMFLHYLPKPIFDRYLRACGLGWCTGDYLHLLGRRQLVRLLGQAGITRFRIRANRLFGLVLDFVVIFE